MAAAKRLRSTGDRACARQDWPAAIECYGAYLAKVPSDAAIWVQYGHALKEAGRLSDAEAAYGKAVEIDPEGEDARLHLVQVLRMQGRMGEIAGLFLERLERAPLGGTICQMERAGFGHQAQAVFDTRPDDVKVGGIFIELGDLIRYLGRNSTVTGIPRVTLAFVHHILHDMLPDAAVQYHFVHQHGDGEGLLLAPHDKMIAIVRAALHGPPDMEAMRALIREMIFLSRPIRLGAGDSYLIVGAFWEYAGNPSWLGGMRRRGVKVGSFIHDLIPITHHQYCVEGMAEGFSRAFADTARQLDFALTNSRFVAGEVGRYLDRHAVPRFPIVPVPLAHELRLDERGGEVRNGATPAAGQHVAPGTSFVLCVCTIEPRKNHAYLFEIWQRMLEAGMIVPDLVFVGQPGWDVEPLMERIRESGHLGGRLHILAGLSDGALADLYDRCLFTAFPSFAEGWGLPVGESLARGKLCVASSATAIPEVGGDHALYIDPFDVGDGFAVISGLLNHPGELRRREEALRASFRPRTWKDVGRDFVAATEQALSGLAQAALPAPIFAPRLPAGRLLDTARLLSANALEGDYSSNPERLAFAKGWRSPELEGAWMQGSEALLILQTDCVPSSEVSLVLHMSGSSWVGPENILCIATGEVSAYRRPLRAETDFWMTMQGRVDDMGRLAIHFGVSGEVYTSGDASPVTVRVKAVGYAPRADFASRVELLERALQG